MSSSARWARVWTAALVVLLPGPLLAGPLGWGPVPAPRVPCPAAAPAAAPADLALVWVDVMGVARFSYPEAAKEVVSLLGRMGVRATVRLGDPRSVTGESELTVVVLPGRSAGSRLDHRVMGATSRSPDGVRALWVYAAGVGATLGLDLRRGPHWAMAQRREFGLALGRVVVHELVHALAPQRPHVKGGLMADRMGRALLLASDIVIDAGTSEALRAAVSGRAPARHALAAVSELSRERGAERP